MNKRIKISILFITLFIGVLTYFEATEPEPINWFPSYSKFDKIPFGTFVSYDIINKAFEENTIKDINQPPYEFLSDTMDIEGTYVFINGTVNFGEAELDKLLSWVDQGNSLFISAKSIDQPLLDTLQLETNALVNINNISTKPIVELTNKNLKSKQAFLLDRDITNRYFSSIDTINTTALGIMQLYNDTLKVKKPKINYIQQKFGEGNIILHTFPEAFTNYFILKDNNYLYTQNMLSYLDPNLQILWDNYYKSGKSTATSPLYMLFKNRYLKWAYYFIILGFVLFIIFEGKRKQRSIPVITPLKNQTLAFTRTISGMYFEKQKHKEIATKQNLLFLDYIRNTLRIPTDHLDEKTLIDISARSNNDIETTKNLFRYFDELSKRKKIEKDQLIKLYDLITDFKNHA